MTVAVRPAPRPTPWGRVPGDGADDALAAAKRMPGMKVYFILAGDGDGMRSISRRLWKR